jgi:AcrR family transcriptional regulator
LQNGRYVLRNARYPAGVPKIVDHEQRRAEIVTAAWQAIASSGIEGATMRRIAERAGCTTGRLTHYFTSRDEILVAALRAVHEAAAARMAAAVAQFDGLDALRAVLHEALPLDAARRREWKVWLAFWGLAAAESSLRREHRARYAEWRLLLQSLLARAVDLGELPPLDVPTETAHLVALVDGLGIQGVLGSGGPDATGSTEVIGRHLDRLHLPGAR